MESEAQVQSIRCMLDAGFEPQNERYLQGMLSAIRRHLLKVACLCLLLSSIHLTLASSQPAARKLKQWQMQDLRNKTRIFVPEATLLMGVVDELGVLEYGQVFIQIDRTLTLDSPQLVAGNVIIAKNPCFHPGDVRVLQVRLWPAATLDRGSLQQSMAGCEGDGRLCAGCGSPRADASLQCSSVPSKGATSPSKRDFRLGS